MNKKPLVSIIITTYKRADMLTRAIDSVLNQTYTNIEIIVVDDNNPDTEYRVQTERKMSKYKNNSKVRYIKHEKNMNGAAARNTGLKESYGELITYLDDDDWYYKTKIEKQVNYLINNNKYQGVYCGWNRNNKLVIPRFSGDVSFELLNGQAIIYTNSIMTWKDAAVNCGGWDEQFKRNQEAVFLLRFFSAGNKIGLVEEVLLEFDTSDRSNALNAKNNHQQMDLYLQKHNYIIDNLKINNAKKIIYSYRYRGILLDYLKSKQIFNAVVLYAKMTIKYPLRFNLDIFKYSYNKLLRNKIK